MATEVNVLLAKARDYSLSMSFDYAAIVSATLFATILLGVIEVLALVKHQVESDTRELEDAHNRIDPDHVRPLSNSERQELSDELTRLMNRHNARFLPHHLGFFILLWLVSAQVLVLYWAAIDGHGKATWVANYSFWAAFTGIASVLGLLMARMQRTQRAMRPNQRKYSRLRTFLAEAPAQESPGPSEGEGAEESPAPATPN